MIRTRRRSARRIRRPILESLEARQLLATFTVTSAADDGGSGTLRHAIGEANAASTPSTIDFKLGTSPATITLTQGQLEVDNYFYGITIDGPGSVDAPPSAATTPVACSRSASAPTHRSRA